jgi:hypothetical protein
VARASAVAATWGGAGGLALAGAVAALAAHRPSPPPPEPFARLALGPDEAAFAESQGRIELDRWAREQSETWLDAVDPGELAEHTHHVMQPAIDQGKASLAAIFLQGEATFDRRFTLAEGLGTGALGVPPPALSRVEHGPAQGGPDAISCRECHSRGGDDGHGELHQRAWLGGDGRHLGTARPRLPPHVAGLGLVQVLAAEMTADLAKDLDYARAVAATHPPAPVTLAMRAKGVSFGSVIARPDGTVDASGVAGVDADLRVRPFGWKGSRATLREFARAALPQHMGLEPLPLDGPEAFARMEARSASYDGDRDGVGGELSEGQLTALATYLALLDAPQLLPPRDPASRAAWARGAATFDRVGCGSCHRSLHLDSPKWTERAPGHEPGLAFDVVADVQVEPRLEQFDYASPGLDVALFSDLRRHDLGARLAERREGGAGEREFVTRPLWGLADRGRYFLHDGRARTLEGAIALHGGEAQAAADAFAALPEGERREVVVFLLSMRRAPQGRIEP